MNGRRSGEFEESTTRGALDCDLGTNSTRESINNADAQSSRPWGNGSIDAHNRRNNVPRPVTVKTFQPSLECIPSVERVPPAAERFPHLGRVEDNAVEPSNNADNEEELHKDASVSFWFHHHHNVNCITGNWT